MRNIHQIREVSTLSFNERVLQEAEDSRNPLMERLKFLGIFSSNMDEFFKVRVASIHRRIELGRRSLREVLEEVNTQARLLDDRFRAAYAEITHELAGEGVRILTEKEIDEQGAEIVKWLQGYFREKVLPSLVPLIVRSDHPMPQLTDGALYFGVRMWGSRYAYAILKIPSGLPRFVELPNGNIMYVDDVIRYMLADILYIFDYERAEAYEFKVSRDAELDIDNDFSEGYIRKMERVLEQRKGGRPTRLVYDAAMPAGLRGMLVRELSIGEGDTVIAGARYHNMKDLMQFPNRRPDLAFRRVAPAHHPVLRGPRYPILDLLDHQDVLVNYPYQSFDHVIQVLREAAIDPRVDEIKMTLYRAAQTSQVVNALVNAARNGKRVFVSIELQARFDELNNIEISEKLAEEGATVVFGIPPMKVHAKLILIRRGSHTYAGLSTGNFNEVTGRLYVDSILLTSDRRLTTEVNRVFEFLEYASRVRTVLRGPSFRNLLVSPFNMRRMLMQLIDEEKEKGADGYLLIKVNHLTDNSLIRRIREAAEAGVKMDFIIRTTYAMLPHPNVRAISILGRYLEHQRVLIFGRGSDRRIFMSSADLMERNLDWRLEVAFPVYDERLKRQISDMMAIQVRDNVKARILDETQSNAYVHLGEDEIAAQHETHRYLLRLHETAVAQSLNAPIERPPAAAADHMRAQAAGGEH